MNEWEKQATDLILGLILHLQTVIQINIIYFCLEKRDTSSGPLYPVPMIMGFGQIPNSRYEFFVCAGQLREKLL